MVSRQLTLLLSLLGCVALSFCRLRAQEREGGDLATPLGIESRLVATPKPYKLDPSDGLQIAKSKAVATDLVSKTWAPKSGKALLWALLPGGGQIYNRKYWKLPIVWGGLMTCAYFISFNSRLYSEYHAAYRDIMSEHPDQNTAWLAFAPRGAKAEDYAQYSNLKNTLQRGDSFYRRNRDLSIVLTIAVYGLSILDAYVDAELFSFDISPDLSMRVLPTVMPPLPNSSSYQVGVACQLTF